jgi:hypothetical protein
MDRSRLVVRFYCTEFTEITADFGKQHPIYWGRLYEAQEVVIEWHGKRFLWD